MKKYYQTAFALGCDIGLCLVTDSQAKADKIFLNLWDMISSFESKYSRFLDNSELTIFNQNSGSRQIVSEEFKNILQSAIIYNVSTGGLFDIFILPALQKSGYLHPFQSKSKQKDIPDFSALEYRSTNKITMEDNTASIPENSAIDLGGIGKGFLADKLADYTDKLVHGYWFSIGGDIIVGGKDEYDKNWRIDIEMPNQSKAYEIVLDLPRYAIATSGISKRRGIIGEKEWHHIIDPRTGKPSSGDIVQATVIAKSATEADILATCSVISGSKKVSKLLQAHSAIDAIMITKDRKGSMAILQLNNLIRSERANSMNNFKIGDLTHA